MLSLAISDHLKYPEHLDKLKKKKNHNNASFLQLNLNKTFVLTVCVCLNKNQVPAMDLEQNVMLAPWPTPRPSSVEIH